MFSNFTEYNTYTGEVNLYLIFKINSNVIKQKYKYVYIYLFFCSYKSLGMIVGLSPF